MLVSEAAWRAFAAFSALLYGQRHLLRLPIWDRVLERRTRTKRLFHTDRAALCVTA